MCYTIYTDGAYSKNKNIGGIGFIIIKDDKIIAQFSKAYKNTTNQRMELLACIRSLMCFKNPSNIILFTDSMYLVGTMTMNWKRNKNLDLWEKLDNLIKCHNIKFYHIKGHSDNKFNNYVDKLAVEATNK